MRLLEWLTASKFKGVQGALEYGGAMRVFFERPFLVLVFYHHRRGVVAAVFYKLCENFFVKPHIHFCGAFFVNAFLAVAQFESQFLADGGCF